MFILRGLIVAVAIGLVSLVVPDSSVAACYDCSLDNNKYYCDEGGDMNYRCRSAPFRVYCSKCDQEIVPASDISATLALHDANAPKVGSCGSFTVVANGDAASELTRHTTRTIAL